MEACKKIEELFGPAVSFRVVITLLAGRNRDLQPVLAGRWRLEPMKVTPVGGAGLGFFCN